MIILGAILLLAGWFFSIGILTWIGLALLLVGLVLLLMGGLDRPVGGRRYWY